MRSALPMLEDLALDVDGDLLAQVAWRDRLVVTSAMLRTGLLT